jgi:hypothetical protein
MLLPNCCDFVYDLQDLGEVFLRVLGDGASEVVLGKVIRGFLDKETSEYRMP